jgi:NADH dehydrogenase
MAGPIQIVIVGGDFVACAARRAWNAACGRRCRGHGGQNPENCMLYTPLLPGRRRAWSNPATWSCRCGGCCAPRQRVGTVTEYRPGLEDLYLRRPSSDEQVLSWDRLVVAPGSVSRLVPVPGLAEHAC